MVRTVWQSGMSSDIWAPVAWKLFYLRADAYVPNPRALWMIFQGHLLSQAVEMSNNAHRWSFIHRIQMLQVCPFSNLTNFLSFMQGTRCWNQDNGCKRAFWIPTKWLFGLQKTSFCVDSATWLSVLLDPLDGLNTSSTDRTCGGLQVIRSKHPACLAVITALI